MWRTCSVSYSATLTRCAARFVYLQRMSFGGKVVGRTFGIDPGRPSRFDITAVGEQLKALHRRLADVTIERLPFDQFITTYDRPGTLFYCDPPYWGTEGYYGKELFPRASFERLAEVLRGLKGRFILSLNDVPEVRRLFAWAHITQVDLNYTVGGGANSKTVSEVIISN